VNEAPLTDWVDVLEALLAGEDLNAPTTTWVMAEMLTGSAPPANTAAFLVALRAKGETAREVSGLVTGMMNASVPLDIEGPVVDTCGTGGDRSHTVNISTMAAVVAAAAGARVAKHGNRAASSQSGSADMLEALGVVIDLPAAAAAEAGRLLGITFCFAPVFHPAMRHIGPIRRELGIRTVFNVLGPLANPAHPAAQVLGVPTGLTAFAGSLMLGYMALPTVISVAEDAIDAVPQSYRDGALAMGATHWQTIWRVVLPSARSGVIIAVMLGVGRAIGETMAVMMVTGNAARMPLEWNALFLPVRTMTATIAAEMGEVAQGSTHYHVLFAVGILLFVVTFIINAVASVVIIRGGPRRGGRLMG